FVFFFFQAEDGIRDYKVTGVQTCALPIFVYKLLSDRAYMLEQQARFNWKPGEGLDIPRVEMPPVGMPRPEEFTLLRTISGHSGRSEERRVGKECRSRR